MRLSVVGAEWGGHVVRENVVWCKGAVVILIYVKLLEQSDDASEFLSALEVSERGRMDNNRKMVSC